MTDHASLNYAGTEGYSGTETSRAYAEETASSAASRQDAVLAHIRSMGGNGATVGEIRRDVIPHHGAASRSLTNLHIAGKLVRLAEVRNRAKVYVVPEHAGGREFEKYQGTAEKHRREAVREVWREILDIPSPSPTESDEFHYGFIAARRASAEICMRIVKGEGEQ